MRPLFALICLAFGPAAIYGAAKIPGAEPEPEPLLKFPNSLYKFENYSFQDDARERTAIQHDVSTCNLSADLIKEIQDYQPIVDRIIEATTQGAWKGKTYDNLATFVDTFGSRVSGSQALEDSIDYILEKMRRDGLEAHGEEAMVPHWIRGEEVAELRSPRKKKLYILGLGTSVGTPVEGIIADVFVVHSFDELTEKAEEAKGKIVVFNQPYTTYGASGLYRRNGAAAAARAGAVAALIRSVAPESLDTPHTGSKTSPESYPFMYTVDRIRISKLAHSAAKKNGD